MKLFNRQIGIALIDAVMAMAFTSIGVLALTNLQLNLTSSSGESQSRNEAMLLAQEKINDVRNLFTVNEFGTYNPTTNTFTANFACTANESVTRGFTTYDRDCSYTPEVVNGEVNRVLLTVDVNWSDRAGDTQTVTLTGYVTWDNPTADTSVSDGTGGGGISPPTGDGYLKKNVTEPDRGEMDAARDGMRIYKEDGGFKIFTDTDNNDEGWTLISSEKLLIISGEISKGGATSDAFMEKIRVMTSDAGLCAFQWVNDSVGEAYLCITPESWYGNLGVISRITEGGQGNKYKYTVCSGSIEYETNDAIITHPLFTTDILGMQRYYSYSDDGDEGNDVLTGLTSAQSDDIFIGELTEQNFSVTGSGTSCAISTNSGATIQLELLITPNHTGGETVTITSVAANGQLCTLEGEAGGVWDWACTASRASAIDLVVKGEDAPGPTKACDANASIESVFVVEDFTANLSYNCNNGSSSNIVLKLCTLDTPEGCVTEAQCGSVNAVWDAAASPQCAAVNDCSAATLSYCTDESEPSCTSAGGYWNGSSCEASLQLACEGAGGTWSDSPAGCETQVVIEGGYTLPAGKTLSISMEGESVDGSCAINETDNSYRCTAI